MLILGTDTSSQAATAAIIRDGTLICEYTLNIENTHSEKLLPLIESMLKDTSLTYDDIDVFACGVGPGSFTGIRIGVATVRGFCAALGKKAVAVNSLFALYNNVPTFSGITVPLIFARADEVFCAAYDENRNEIRQPSVMKVTELIEEFKGQKCLFLGNGAEKFCEVLKGEMGSSAFFTPPHLNIIKASSVCQAAYTAALNNKFTDYSRLEPVYLRRSQAEREYNLKKTGEIV